jgi:hypothetical protein
MDYREHEHAVGVGINAIDYAVVSSQNLRPRLFRKFRHGSSYLEKSSDVRGRRADPMDP